MKKNQKALNEMVGLGVDEAISILLDIVNDKDEMVMRFGKL